MDTSRDEDFDCCFNLRSNPVRHLESVRIGCGAGFAGDRPASAAKLLKQVPNLNYLVLECLAERTLSNRYDAMASGGKGYDPRISDWMKLLLPLALEREVCLITNMGAIDPIGAQDEVLKIAAGHGLEVTVAVAYEIQNVEAGRGSSTYLGAAPIVRVLETSRPDVIITSRTADAALFLAPMVFELGWNWDQFEKLSQGTLAGHLLECGCQLTGGYFMHPADGIRNISCGELFRSSLPFVDLSWNGEVILGIPPGSGGELSVATCSQQLLYEIGDPAAYITPDVVVDFTDVTFVPISESSVQAKNARSACSPHAKELLRIVPEHCGWKGWGEISYGGAACEERARAADCLVRMWMEESFPKSTDVIASYMIGKDSLGIISAHQAAEEHYRIPEVRLRLDGLFSTLSHAKALTEELEALYTNGPAGGGGISTGFRRETALQKILVPRDSVRWATSVKCTPGTRRCTIDHVDAIQPTIGAEFVPLQRNPAPAGVKMPLYKIAHGRTGDKGNQINVSLIPHCASDISRLRALISPEWVRNVVGRLQKGSFSGYSPPIASESISATSGPLSSFCEADRDARIDIYEVRGISALNIVVGSVLDGGVTISRRLDRHGKSLSDLILSQWVRLG